MMTGHEKWEYARNMDEIIERLSDLVLKKSVTISGSLWIDWG
jgi:hypothetical protein